MLENVAYAALGFVSVYLALELARHFTACRLRSKEIQPCIFKEVETILVGNPR